MRQSVPSSRPRLLSRLRRNQDGLTSVEVLVSLPVILALTIFGYELGLALVRHTMLERATDVVVRDVRIGKIAAGDYDTIRGRICEKARIIPECAQRLKLEVMVTDPYAEWSGMAKNLDCVTLAKEQTEGGVKIVTTGGTPRSFDAASGNQLVVMRSCVAIQPFSGTGVLARAMTQDTPKDQPLAYNLTSITSYVMEP